MKYKYSIYTVIGMITLIGIIMLISFVTSAQTINSVYDELTRTYTLSIGNKDIANLTLLTPYNVQTGLGYQKVAEFSVSTTQANYKIENFKKFMETYDLKRSNESINQIIDYKVLEYIQVNDTELVCIDNILGNGTIEKNCNSITLLTVHNESTWNEISNFTLSVATPVTISLWTDVQQGDYKEWILTTVGDIRLDRWATWTGNMSTSILSYYKFENNVVDELGANNGVDSGSDDAAGIVLRGRMFVKASNDYVNIGSNTIDLTDGNATWNFWSNLTSIVDNGKILGSTTTGGYGIYTFSDGRIAFGNIGADEAGPSVMKVLTNKWVMITVTYDASANLVTFYINGTADSGGAKAYSTTFTAGKTYYIGNGYVVGGTYAWNGIVDEVGVWTRVLSAGEISLLYNSGNGCAYGNENCFATPSCAFQVGTIWSVPSKCLCISPPNTMTMDLSTWSCKVI